MQIHGPQVTQTDTVPFSETSISGDLTRLRRGDYFSTYFQLHGVTDTDLQLKFKGKLKGKVTAILQQLGDGFKHLFMFTPTWRNDPI